MDYDLSSISDGFQAGEEFHKGEPYGTGHIHDTFAVYRSSGTRVGRYLLQRINRKVFSDPGKLMENIDRVTRHIRAKLEARKIPAVERAVLTPIRTRDGSLLYRDGAGDFWRMYVFIEDATAYDLPEDLRHVREAARAFGEFQDLLRDLPGALLHETIPGFHDGLKRFGVFQAVVTADPLGRAATVRDEIGFLQAKSPLFDVVPRLVAGGTLPIRTTHNDTKINNVLLDDRSGQAICVIDLDTVMAGVSLSDFGDLVRSCGASAAEDEKDLSKVFLDVAKFKAIVKGYLSSAGSFLTPVERRHLVHGAKWMTLMVGARFLTDYLDGDRYFKTRRPGHNLDRCRTQFKLLRSIEEREDELERIVEGVSRVS